MHAPHLLSPIHQTSPIHRAPAVLKFSITLLLVLFVSLLPPTMAIWLLLPAHALLLIAFIAKIPALPFFKRLLMLEPFVLGVALMALFSPTSADRFLLFLFLVARCTLALITLLLFSATTPFTDLLLLFRTLHIPQLLVTTLALMHRYLFVLSDESARMRRARQSRSFTPKRPLAWLTNATVIAQLFLRASTRADRIYDAMRARGWGSRP